MTSRDFAYWLQGLFELAGEDCKSLDERQTSLIKAHLQLVFVHEIDKSMPNVQLDAIHKAAVEKARQDAMPQPAYPPSSIIPTPTAQTDIYRC